MKREKFLIRKDEDFVENLNIFPCSGVVCTSYTNRLKFHTSATD